MMKNKIALTLALLLAFAASGVAQELQIGDKFPKIPTEEMTNTKYKAAADLKGKLVLVEFFAHW